MKKSLITAAVFAFSASVANAASFTYDFIDAIDGATGPINESIWTSYTTVGDPYYVGGPGVTLTGHNITGQDANGGNIYRDVYAYADASTAGFGVCQRPRTQDVGNVNVAKPYASNGQNVCYNGGDDSIQTAASNSESLYDEVLRITIESNWSGALFAVINANHDGPGLMIGQTFTLDGVVQTVTAGGYYTSGSKGYFRVYLGNSFTAGDSFEIGSANNPNLYLSAITDVPLPAGLVLMLTGLGGIAVARRRARA